MAMGSLAAAGVRLSDAYAYDLRRRKSRVRRDLAYIVQHVGSYAPDGEFMNANSRKSDANDNPFTQFFDGFDIPRMRR